MNSSWLSCRALFPSTVFKQICARQNHPMQARGMCSFCQLISNLCAYVLDKLIFHTSWRMSKFSGKPGRQLYISREYMREISYFSPFLCLAESGSDQDYVTTEPQLLYYPSITYAIIGSSAIFVLVVALLALVLHHQRKRNNLMTLPVHRLQHPVLLSRLVVLDHPHHCSVTYNVNNGVQYMSSQAYHRPPDLDSPPSYSEAVLDQRYVQEAFISILLIWISYHSCGV